MPRVGVIDPLGSTITARTAVTRIRGAGLACRDRQVVTDSGLRGRGRAFPTGIKWRTVLNPAARPHKVSSAADEGTRARSSPDHEGDPFVEEAAIAGIGVGATRVTFICAAISTRARRALGDRHGLRAGYLGANVGGAARPSRAGQAPAPSARRLRSGRGRRGRCFSPAPAIAGLFGCPTVINNVITNRIPPSTAPS